MPASEIKTFDANVKQKVLNHEKRKKTSKFDTCLCHVLPFHYDAKMVYFHFLTFQRTESSGQVIILKQDWHKHPDRLS